MPALSRRVPAPSQEKLASDTKALADKRSRADAARAHSQAARLAADAIEGAGPGPGSQGAAADASAGFASFPPLSGAYGAAPYPKIALQLGPPSTAAAVPRLAPPPLSPRAGVSPRGVFGPYRDSSTPTAEPSLYLSRTRFPVSVSPRGAPPPAPEAEPSLYLARPRLPAPTPPRGADPQVPAAAAAAAAEALQPQGPVLLRPRGADGAPRATPPSEQSSEALPWAGRSRAPPQRPEDAQLSTAAVRAEESGDSDAAAHAAAQERLAAARARLAATKAAAQHQRPAGAPPFEGDSLDDDNLT